MCVCVLSTEQKCHKFFVIIDMVHVLNRHRHSLWWICFFASLDVDANQIGFGFRWENVHYTNYNYNYDNLKAESLQEKKKQQNLV